MLFRFSFLVAASVSAFALAHINIECSRRRRNSSTKSPNQNDDSSFLHEQIQEIDNFEDSNVESEQEEVTINTSKCKHDLKHAENMKNVAEIEKLKIVIKEMEERRVISEVKLLELYGLRDQQVNIAQLQNHSEAKIIALNVTVGELRAERKKLIEEIEQNQLVEEQLEIVRKRVLELEVKSRVDSSRMKQLMMIKEQVYGVQMEETPITDAKVENKVRAVKDLEMKVVELKRRNKELQLEKRELAIKLVVSQGRVTALSNMTESKIVAEIVAETSSLRLANEELSKQADRLLQNRFGMVEELMYQRWLNACLGFEIQNTQNPQLKTPKSYRLRKNSSCELHRKTKQPSLDSTLGSISSSESDENTPSTIDSSSSSQNSVLKTRKKSSLIHKIKRWGRIDTGPISSLGSRISAGLVRRFSMSSVPLNTPNLKNGDSALITPSSVQNPLNFHRVRRVSFNDSVQTVASSAFEVTKNSVDNEKTSTKRLENSTITTTSTRDRSTGRLEEENSEFSPPAIYKTVIKTESSSNLSKKDDQNVHDNEETEAISKSDIAMEESGRLNMSPGDHKQVGSQNLVHLVAALFLFLLVLLVCWCMD